MADQGEMQGLLFLGSCVLPLQGWTSVSLLDCALSVELRRARGSGLDKGIGVRSRCHMYHDERIDLGICKTNSMAESDSFLRRLCMEIGAGVDRRQCNELLARQLSDDTFDMLSRQADTQTRRHVWGG